MSVREYVLVPLEKWKELKTDQANKQEMTNETCDNKESGPSNHDDIKSMFVKTQTDDKTDKTRRRTWIKY